jgi:hypothetical protein
VRSRRTRPPRLRPRSTRDRTSRRRRRRHHRPPKPHCTIVQAPRQPRASSPGRMMARRTPVRRRRLPYVLRGRIHPTRPRLPPSQRSYPLRLLSYQVLRHRSRQSQQRASWRRLRSPPLAHQRRPATHPRPLTFVPASGPSPLQPRLPLARGWPSVLSRVSLGRHSRKGSILSSRPRRQRIQRPRRRRRRRRLSYLAPC